MTDRVIRVVLDPSGVESGSKRSEAALGRIDRSTKQTSSSLRTLKRVAVAAVGALGVREIIRYADSWTTVGNRLRLVTDSSEEYNAVQRKVIDLANETRSPLEATVDLYSRVARSTEELGISQQEVLDVTRTVNQAIQVSGATAAEAGAGVVQFAQGLASGALRGDELRSVLEQMPRLARALADGLGVGIGELRELGSEGELTAEKVIGALQKTAPEIASEFDKLEVTVGSAFSVLGNSALEFFGRLGEGTGATNLLADSILAVAEVIRTDLLDGVNTFIESFSIAVGLVSDGLDTMETDTDAFAFAASESLGFVADALVSLPTNLVTLVQIATTEIASFIERTETRISQFANTVSGVVNTALGRDAAVEANIAKGFELQRELESEINAITETRNFITEQSLQLEDELRAKIEARKTAEEEASSVDLNRRRGSGGGGGGGPDQDTLDKQAKFLAGLQSTATELAIQTALLDNAEPVLTRYGIAQEAAAIGGADFVDAALELADQINDQTAALTAAEEAQAAYQDRLELAAEITESVKTETELYNEQLAILEQLSAEGLISEETFRRAKQNLDSSGDAFKTFLEQARRNAQDILADGLAGLLTGDLEDVPRQFANTLLELSSQLLASEIFRLLGGLGGDSSGGFLAAIGSFFGGGRQFGGSVRADQAVVVGEGGPQANPEVFVPSTAGTIVPNGQQAQAPQQDVSLTNVNLFDSSDLLGALQTPEGERVLLNFVTTKQTSINRSLGRGA